MNCRHCLLPLPPRPSARGPAPVAHRACSVLWSAAAQLERAMAQAGPMAPEAWGKLRGRLLACANARRPAKAKRDETTGRWK